MKTIYSILTIICFSVFAVSCNNDAEDLEQQKGYLKLDFETFVSTNTRAVTSLPSGYDARTLHVTIADNQGNVVYESQDAANDSYLKSNITLLSGTYTITANSAGWDGSDSGIDAPYYAGSTNVTIKANTLTQATVTLTQANVKVTVKFDSNFSTYFKNVACIVSSANEEVTVRRFTPSTTTGSAYFPVDALNFALNVTNMSGQSYSLVKDITEVKARDHFIINYKIAEAGSVGGITVKFDDSTQSYTFDVEVPRKSSTSLNAQTANAFSTFAYLTGVVIAKTSEFSDEHLTLQWRKSTDSEWISIPISSLTKGEQDSYSYTLSGLTPETEYVYRMNYNDGNTNVNSNETVFTTEKAIPIYNAGFEDWCKIGKVWMPNEQGTTYWDSSNSGSAGMMGEQYNVTTSTTEYVHSGTYAAKIQSMYVIIKFAAGSIFTGEFGELKGTNGASLKWGVPFTSRPSALKAWMRYSPGNINRGSKPSGVGAPDSGAKDFCSFRVALMTKQLDVDNTDMSTFPAWDGSDPRILAYGYYEQNTADADWKQVNIPLTYYNTTTKPSYMLIAIASSKWGDYFYGSDSSVLYLDDLEFVYGEPTTK